MVYVPGNVVETRIAGVTFGNAQEILRRITPGQSVILVREPRNIHDPNAIRIVLSRGLLLLGYIPKELASEIAPYIDKLPEKGVAGYISAIYHVKNERSILGAMVKFSVPNVFTEDFLPDADDEDDLDEDEEVLEDDDKDDDEYDVNSVPF